MWKLGKLRDYAKSWLIEKDSDTGRDWGQEEKGTTEDEMAGWHHWLDGHEFQWTPRVGDGQRGLACCDSWGRKESDTTEQLNWTETLTSTSVFQGSRWRTGKVKDEGIQPKGVFVIWQISNSLNTSYFYITVYIWTSQAPSSQWTRQGRVIAIFPKRNWRIGCIKSSSSIHTTNGRSRT